MKYKVLDIALAEVGYKEKSSNSDLYDKDKNVGYNNYTKYNKEMHDLYPTVMDYPCSWCDSWVDWCFYKAYGIANAKNMIGGNFDDYTVNSARLYKDKGQYYKTPLIGDQIFFTNGTRICHTGLVYDVDSTYVYTIEGNTSNGSGLERDGGCVAQKRYKLNYAKIDGYGRPKYPEDIDSEMQMSRIKVIDVSKNQWDIDWAKIKASGCSKVIIKVISRLLPKEESFEAHYSGCKANGVDIVGVYNYTYANTVRSFEMDARRVVEALGNRYTKVWLDIEDEMQKNLGQELIDGIKAYRDIILTSGNEFGVYTGLSFYKSFIKPYASQLKDVDFWIARYYNGHKEMIYDTMPNSFYMPIIDNKMVMWQYTSSCRINGAPRGVDMNVTYDEDTKKEVVPQVEQNLGFGIVTASSLNVRNKPSTLGKKVGLLMSGERVTIVAYSNGWYQIDNGNWVSAKYIGTRKSRVTAYALNIRDKCGLSGRIIGTFKNGEIVNILNSKNDENGKVWYLCQNGTRCGWCSSKYIV